MLNRRVLISFCVLSSYSVIQVYSTIQRAGTSVSPKQPRQPASPPSASIAFTSSNISFSGVNRVSSISCCVTPTQHTPQLIPLTFDLCVSFISQGKQQESCDSAHATPHKAKAVDAKKTKFKSSKI